MLNRFMPRTDPPVVAMDTHTEWQPSADIYRMTDGRLINVELAGVRPDELQLLTEGCEIVLSGRRRDWIIEHGRQCQSMEIAYSCFERRFVLPCRVDECRIATEYRDGMLMIRVVSC